MIFKKEDVKGIAIKVIAAVITAIILTVFINKSKPEEKIMYNKDNSIKVGNINSGNDVTIGR